MRRSGAATLAAALALGLPAGALAQSAGDDQYRDPFAGDEQGQGSGDGTDGSTGGGSTGGSTQTSPPPTATVPAPNSVSAPVATTAGELPRTGLAAGVVTVAGFLLLAAGFGLRRTVRA